MAQQARGLQGRGSALPLLNLKVFCTQRSERSLKKKKSKASKKHIKCDLYLQRQPHMTSFTLYSRQDTPPPQCPAIPQTYGYFKPHYTREFHPISVFGINPGLPDRFPLSRDSSLPLFPNSLGPSDRRGAR